MELKPFTAFVLFTALASVHAMGGTAAEAMVKLDAAEQLWKRNAPAAYSFKFSYGGQVSWTACPDGFRAQVDGNVALDPMWCETLSKDFGTVPMLFAYIRNVLAKAPDAVDLTYDERYGYPRSFSVDYRTNISDDHFSFNVQDFAPKGGDGVKVLGQTWQVGHTANDEQQYLTEYVLPGEKVEQWSALVTRLFIKDPDEQFNIKRLMKLQRALFPPDCINLAWTVVRQSKTEVLYTWQHDSCDQAPAEAERALLKRVPGGLCRWSYATRVDPLNTKNLDELDADLAMQACEQPN